MNDWGAKRQQRDWTPVRRGNGTKQTIYCSPACGGGCTWKAHQDAVKAGATLATRLGPAWQSRVWENLGWHYAAELGGRLTVCEYSPNEYSLYGYRGGVVKASSLKLVLRHLKRIIQADIRDAQELLKAMA